MDPGPDEERGSATDGRSLALLFGGNVLYSAGLFVHAFLFNFYLRELQLPASVMGHQVAAMTIGGMCALLPAGAVIDRLGFRVTLVVGVALTVAGLALTALARDVAPIYAGAFVTGFGGASCRVAWGPAIMRVAGARTGGGGGGRGGRGGSWRERAFTWNAALLIGAGSGWTWLSGYLPDWLAGVASNARLTGTQAALLAGAGVSALAVLCYAFLPSASRSLAARRRLTLGWARESGGLVPLIAFWMLAAALVLPFFNIYFADRHGVPVARVGALFASTHLATAAILVGAAELARRGGAQRMLVAWMLLMAPALLGLSLAATLPLAVALYMLQGLVAPATNPLIDQLLLERTPRDRHGIMAGWRNAAAEVAGAVGASLGGRLLSATSFATLFLVSGVVAAASAATLTAALRRRPLPAPPPRADPAD